MTSEPKEVPMRVHRFLSAAAVPLFAGLVAIGATVTSGHADPASGGDAASQGPLRCEIQKSAANGLLSLAAVVHSDAAVSGSYSFRVVSGGHGGSSNIDQGGAFAADPAAAVTLGTVMLNTDASYTATLTVKAGGTTVACSDK
jgi:CsgH protein